MSAADLLSRLHKVRKTGRGAWNACCPAHQDRSPSMSVRELDDGTVLLHCFAGCSAHEIVGAVGMAIEDLFPPREHHAKPNPRPFHPGDVLRLVAVEAMIVAASAATMRQRALTEAEVDRLIEAAAKINGAMNACGLAIDGL